jgi:hypothetical protein
MSSSQRRRESVTTLHDHIMDLSYEDDTGHNIHKMIQFLAGGLVEYALIFEDSEQALETVIDRLASNLSEPYDGELPEWLLTAPYLADLNTEKGRKLMRHSLDEWPSCEFDFAEMLIELNQHFLMRWAEDGIPCEEAFRLLIDYAYYAMAFEIAAQQLCDTVIEKHIGARCWSLGDAISGLSGSAGRQLARAFGDNSKDDIDATLDLIMPVMTQESVRMGLPAGSDWRFGLAANDHPVDAPRYLVDAVEPYCNALFRSVSLNSPEARATACAKAAGRMLAVAAGGEEPEITPVIAKPLALAAMTETYKSAFAQD